VSESANVSAIDAVQDWKEAVCVFRTEAIEALGAVEMEIRRAFDWVTEQTRFWQTELRRREEAVLVAKNELVRKKMMPIIGKNPDTTEEEKRLRKAKLRLEEAEAKVEKTQKMNLLLRREVDEYEGPGRALGHLLDSDVPNAVALLERKLDALDAYTSLSTPREPKPAAPPAETTES
jgi:hypothetical protein